MKETVTASKPIPNLNGRSHVFIAASQALSLAWRPPAQFLRREFGPSTKVGENILELELEAEIRAISNTSHMKLLNLAVAVPRHRRPKTEKSLHNE